MATSRVRATVPTTRCLNASATVHRDAYNSAPSTRPSTTHLHNSLPTPRPPFPTPSLPNALPPQRPPSRTPPLPHLPPPDRTQYAVHPIALSEVRCLRRHSPPLGLGWGCPSLTVVLASGVTLPPLHFTRGGIKALITTLKQVGAVVKGLG